MTDDMVRDTAVGHGADFYGVADLSPAHDFIEAQGGEAVARFPRAVAIGKALINTVVDQMSNPPEKKTAQLYRYFCYDLVNDQLDKIVLATTMAIQKTGYAAFPIPAAVHAVDGTRLVGVFSSKLAAHLSGLGWIGKNCLLVTPENGPRVRWASVLTDAPLTPTGTMVSPKCGDCDICVHACPVSALTGRPFSQEENRDERIRASDCDAYLRTTRERLGVRACGMCMQSCPQGKKSGRTKQ
jgi:epoxyqueuosine reductase